MSNGGRTTQGEDPEPLARCLRGASDAGFPVSLPATDRTDEFPPDVGSIEQLVAISEDGDGELHVVPSNVKGHAPATLRNREPILAALRRILPETARVLEIGSGTGEHAAFFCDAMPTWTWQPTDPSPSAVASIEAHRHTVRSSGMLPPLALDVRTTDWPPGPFDAVFSANVIHIAPWTVCLGILDGASRVLAPDGILLLYGPFRFGGAFLADSNAAFDARLRAENPEWGVRDVSDLTRAACTRGFAEPQRLALPANNHLLAFGRGGVSTEADAGRRNGPGKQAPRG